MDHPLFKLWINYSLFNQGKLHVFHVLFVYEFLLLVCVRKYGEVLLKTMLSWQSG